MGLPLAKNDRGQKGFVTRRGPSCLASPAFGDKRGMKRGMGSVNPSYSRTNQRSWPVFFDLSRLCSIVLDVLIQDNNYPAHIFRLQPPRNRHFRSIYSVI